MFKFYSLILFSFVSFSLLPICEAGPLKLAPIKFELFDNRILVDVFINGQGPFKFIFDTGGGNSMTYALAHKLNLPVKDAGQGTGAGNGSQSMGETHVKSMQFGEIVQTDLDFYVMDYSKIQKAFGFKALDGIFGFEVLQKYLTVIDYENLILTLYENPSSFDPSSFAALKFELIYDKPFIKTVISGFTAHTLLDTGDRSALTVTKQFQNHPAIARAFQGQPEIVSGYGIGGPIPAQISTLGSVTIGTRFHLKNVASRAPTGPGGFNSFPGLDASIGNEILKQFTVGFDYLSQTLYLKKNKNFGTPTVFTPVPYP
jgi:predicted acetyltransferase